MHVEHPRKGVPPPVQKKGGLGHTEERETDVPYRMMPLNNTEAHTMLSAMAQPTRFRIMCTLATMPMGVLRLSEYVGVSAGTVSYHTRILQEVGLIASHSRGLCVDAWGVADLRAFLGKMVDDAKDPRHQ